MHASLCTNLCARASKMQAYPDSSVHGCERQCKRAVAVQKQISISLEDKSLFVVLTRAERFFSLLSFGKMANLKSTLLALAVLALSAATGSLATSRSGAMAVCFPLLPGSCTLEACSGAVVSARTAEPQIVHHRVDIMLDNTLIVWAGRFCALRVVCLRNLGGVYTACRDQCDLTPVRITTLHGHLVCTLSCAMKECSCSDLWHVPLDTLVQWLHLGASDKPDRS